jgi:hypothetical protein
MATGDSSGIISGETGFMYLFYGAFRTYQTGK